MPTYQKASDREIQDLIKLKQLEAQVQLQDRQIQAQAPKIRVEDPEGQPLLFPSPAHLLLVLAPHLPPHKWQTEMLMMLAGYLTPGDYTNRTLPTPENPLRLCLPAANGSGKDQFLIALFAIWFCLCGMRNRVIITSSSFEQTKYQTEVHIRDFIGAVNKTLGPYFTSVEFYHVCKLTGSEIKLFATDEPGKAEGYHPYPGGKMAIIINEAKTVDEEIFEALARCTGYSYWLEISSPAGRTGHFYQSSLNAVPWPEPCQLGKYYLRHISAYECPHIPRSHIDAMKERMTEWWFNSSVLALFSDFSESVVIPESIFLSTPLELPQIGADIGIGLDLAAGGDENSCYVRRGNKLVEDFHFVQKNTAVAIDVIDTRLNRYKDGDYTFNADDGGIGHAIIDQLTERGWNIRRKNNQSAAMNKREFLNIGAEMYFKVRRLFEKHVIPRPDKDPILRRQLTTRYYDQRDGGKFKLEPKPAARARSGESPDRADAYVLCYASFDQRAKAVVEAKPVFQSLENWAYLKSWGRINIRRPSYGRPTIISKL